MPAALWRLMASVAEVAQVHGQLAGLAEIVDAINSQRRGRGRAHVARAQNSADHKRA